MSPHHVALGHTRSHWMASCTLFLNCDPFSMHQPTTCIMGMARVVPFLFHPIQTIVLLCVQPRPR
jgi:hypothetical protein